MVVISNTKVIDNLDGRNAVNCIAEDKILNTETSLKLEQKPACNPPFSIGGG